MGKGTIITDTIHGKVNLTEFEKKIISQIVFNRMHSIYQNSTVYLTFPCNRTKRFEHSVGTMKLCGDMFYYAICNTRPQVLDRFLQTYAEEMKQILRDIKEKKFEKYARKLGDSVNKLDCKKLPKRSKTLLFGNQIPGNLEDEKQRETYAILFQSVRAAALLHDIGHPPFSHIVEFALDAVYEEERKNIQPLNQRQSEFLEILGRFYGTEGGKKKELHEEMGKDITDTILSSIIRDVNQSKACIPDVYERQVWEILVKEVTHRILNNDGIFRNVHKIIDGTLDGDRLDYVTRDPINSGMDCGKIEFERITERMCIAEQAGSYYFCADIKSLNTVEDFLMRRWLMYKNIIFHHRVIKTDYLLQKCVEELCRIYIREGDDPSAEMGREQHVTKEILNEQEEGFDPLLLPYDISGLWKAMKKGTAVDMGNAICQWDDSWLMTVLKACYFRQYTFLDERHPHFVLSKQLQEILTNEKQYVSLIKRREDFKLLDDAFSGVVNQAAKQLSEAISTLQQYGEKDKRPSADESSGLKEIPVEAYLNVLREMLNRCTQCDTVENKLGFALRYFMKQFGSFIETETYANIDVFVNEIIKNVRTRFFTADVIGDILILSKKFKVGTANPLYFWDGDKERIDNINHISGITNILNLNVDFFPPFFIYVLCKDDCQVPMDEKTAFLEQIGKQIATIFVNVTIKRLNGYIDVFSCGAQAE